MLYYAIGTSYGETTDGRPRLGTVKDCLAEMRLTVSFRGVAPLGDGHCPYSEMHTANDNGEMLAIVDKRGTAVLTVRFQSSSSLSQPRATLSS